jgi:phenylacetate-CoA ligase
MSVYSPQEEFLDRPSLEALQRGKFALVLELSLKCNAFYRAKLRGLRDSPFEALPFTTRGEIEQDQRDQPPYGTNLSFPLSEYCRLHQTSGTASGAPLRCLDRPADWDWWKKCWRIIFAAAGLTPTDRLIFPFSFGPFVGFWAAFEAAVSLGNLCLPAGGMTTVARLRFLIDNGVTVICCTPTYALHMAEVARAEGINLARSSVRALIVAGEPGGSIPATRAAIEGAFGARAFDHAGMTEVGPYSFECEEAPGGIHILESDFIAETIEPQSARPVADGHPGELVLTSLGRLGSPLIRYRTGDQVRLTRGHKCRCGRHFARLEGGILGRTDDMLIVRGNNVYPSAIEAILREFAEVVEFRLTPPDSHAPGGLVDLTVEIEPSPGVGTDGLTERVTHAIRDRLNFRPQVKLLAPGALPRFEMKAHRIIRQKP